MIQHPIDDYAILFGGVIMVWVSLTFGYYKNPIKIIKNVFHYLRSTYKNPRHT